MSDGITLAFSGAVAQAEALDVAAQNLANASTVGFRGLRPVFQQILAAAGAAAARPVIVAGTRADLGQGPLRATGGALDVALRGPGFLVVATPAGERYTRAGNLAVSADGLLVDAGGRPVLGDGAAPLRLPRDAGAVAIDAGGEVRAGGATVGRLRIVEFADPARLGPEGESLWRAEAGAGPHDAAATEVVAGHLEQSNVDVVRGLVELVRISRAYDAFSRTLQTFRDVDQRAANELGRPR